MKLFITSLLACSITVSSLAQNDSLPPPPPPPSNVPPLDMPMPWDHEPSSEFINQQKKYETLNIGLGMIIPMSDNDSLVMSSGAFSSSFSITSREKYRITDHLGIGYSLGYNVDNYHLEQDSAQLLWMGQDLDKQRLTIHKIMGDVFFRVIFTKPNDKPGIFLDLGAQASWNIGRRMNIEDGVDSKIVGASRIESSYRKLAYVAPFEAQALARIGLNYCSIVAKYRLTDLFVAHESTYGDKQLPNLSPIIVGLEFNIGD